MMKQTTSQLLRVLTLYSKLKLLYPVLLLVYGFYIYGLADDGFYQLMFIYGVAAVVIFYGIFYLIAAVGVMVASKMVFHFKRYGYVILIIFTLLTSYIWVRGITEGILTPTQVESTCSGVGCDQAHSSKLVLIPHPYQQMQNNLSPLYYLLLGLDGLSIVLLLVLLPHFSRTQDKLKA